MKILPPWWLWGWSERRDQEGSWGGLKASLVINSYHGLDKAWVFPKGSCKWRLISYMVILRGKTEWKFIRKGLVWVWSPWLPVLRCVTHVSVCTNARMQSATTPLSLQDFRVESVSFS